MIGRNTIIVGSPGSGKSTLALELGDNFGLRVIHMDQLYWLPGWTARESDALPDIVAEAIRLDGWIFDGNNSRTLPLRGEKADTLIYLDLPRSLCLQRVLARIAASHGKVRPDMAEGCPEQLDPDFLKWVWTFPRHSAPGLGAFFETFPRQKYRLRSVDEVAEFRRSMMSEQTAAASAD